MIQMFDPSVPSQTAAHQQQRDAPAHVPTSNPPLHTFAVPASLNPTAYTIPASSADPVDEEHFSSAGGNSQSSLPQFGTFGGG